MQLKRHIRGLGSAVVFAAAACFLLQNVELGLLLTFTLLFHELGHIAQLQRFGIDWILRFGALGAATISPRSQRRALNHFQNAIIHISGPLANVTQALLAIVIYAIASQGAGAANAGWLLRVANLAALLALINLLPLGRMSDGGQFAHRIFRSLTERDEVGLLWTLLLWLASLVWLLAVSWGDTLRTLGTVAVGIWFVVGMIVESEEDAPGDAASPRAMTRPQGAVLFGLLAASLLLSTAIVVFTPFWITYAHLQAMANGLAILLVLGDAHPLIALGIVSAAIVLGVVLWWRRRAGTKDLPPENGM